MTPIEKFRRSFRRSESLIQLNNAGLSPLSIPACEAHERWLRRFSEEGAFCVAEANAESETARDELARLLNCGRDQIAFFANTASALSQVAFGLPLKADDEVLVWDQEYPSNFYPWKVAAERAGAKFIMAPSGPRLETPAETLLERITPRTRVIAFSWVQYRSGAMTDLAAVTKETRARGIFTCADVIQGAGVLPFDFSSSGLDAACGGSHKWMAALPGIGFLCLRPDHVAKLAPNAVGATSFGSWDDLSSPMAKIKSDISRFEPGAKDFVNLISFAASLRLLRETGIQAIAAEAERLAKLLVAGLSEKGYRINSPHVGGHRGAIVNFAPGTNSPLKSISEIAERLTEKKIGFALRPPGVRLSPHAFNRDEEIATVLKLL